MPDDKKKPIDGIDSAENEGNDTEVEEELTLSEKLGASERDQFQRQGDAGVEDSAGDSDAVGGATAAETREDAAENAPLESEVISSAVNDDNILSSPEPSTPKKKMLDRLEVKIGLAVAGLIIIIGMLFYTHVFCIHQWTEATCTEDSVCTICGSVGEKAMGHKMNAATCTEPAKCGRCGFTEGKALGHDWADATCTSPKTCRRCGGKALEEPLGHDVQNWTVTKEASCSGPGSREGVCSRCGETITETIAALDHTPGDWTITKDVSISAAGSVTPGTEERVCTVCGKVLDSRQYTVDVTISQKNALRKAAQYLNYTAFSYTGLIDQLEFEGYSTEDATFAVDHCGADWMIQAELKAEQYMDYAAFSRSGLIGQLEFEGFTAEQAAHGADHVGL